MNRTLKYNSIFLGTAILLFGFAKVFDPFRTWFHTQIDRSGLPLWFIPLGMAAEMSIGLSLILTAVFSERLSRSLFRPIVALASAGLVASMAVAVYVHLKPEVPAGVLPLGIKPPVIPGLFLLLAGMNLFQLYRAPASG